MKNGLFFIPPSSRKNSPQRSSAGAAAFTRRLVGGRKETQRQVHRDHEADKEHVRNAKPHKKRQHFFRGTRSVLTISSRSKFTRSLSLYNLQAASNAESSHGCDDDDDEESSPHQSGFVTFNPPPPSVCPRQWHGDRRRFRKGRERENKKEVR